MDAIYKTFKAEVKSVDEKEGTLDIFIPLSTNSIDRDGEVIEPNAFKKVLPKFMKHPVLVASHNYGDLLKQIGEWTKLRITENGLEGKPRYYKGEGNPEADWAFNLASKGRAAFSVGFIPDMNAIEEGDGVKTPRRTYKNIADLLEISQCIIPSNRESIQTIRAKSVGDKVITELCDEVETELKTVEAGLKDAKEGKISKVPDEVTKPDTTNFIHIPVAGEEGKHTGHKIRTISISDKEGIQAHYCIPDKVITGYLFDKAKWDRPKAEKWVKDHSKSLDIEDIILKQDQMGNTPPDQQESFINIPVDDSNHSHHTVQIVDVDSGAGISSFYCVNCDTILNYLFDITSNWTMETAQSWVFANESKSITKSTITEHCEKSVSQEELLDDIDYLSLEIEKHGMNDKVKESLQALVDKYLVAKVIIEPTANKDVIQVTTEPVKENNIEIAAVKIESPVVIKVSDSEILDEIKNIKL